MRRPAFTLALLLAVSQPLGAQSADSTSNLFIGTWRLASWQQRLADGSLRQDPRTVGYIIYTADGRMCSLGMDPNRPRWLSGTAPTGAEALSTMAGTAFYAYCARVEIHVSEGFVLHHVEIDRSPNAVGSIRKRWFTFQGPNRVALRIDPSELTSPVVESILAWERVEP